VNLDTAGHQRSLELRELPLASRGAAPTCQRSGEATSAVCGTGSSGRESRPRAQARATEQGQSGGGCPDGGRSRRGSPRSLVRDSGAAAHGPLLTLIRRYLEAGGLASGVLMERHDGTPQGGPLSPLLANVLLDRVDQELEQRGLAFVRYADDCNVYVESKRVADRIMEGLIGLYAELKLQINPARSAVAPVVDRAFLDYSFWRVERGRIVKRGASLKALATLKARVREITARSRGWGFSAVLRDLRSYLRGWKAYFRLAETPSELAKVDGWIRRRLRLLRVIQCKHGPTPYRVLRAPGLSQRAAASAARHCRRWWSTAGHPATQTAFPASYFDGLGIPRLSAL